VIVDLGSGEYAYRTGRRDKPKDRRRTRGLMPCSIRQAEARRWLSQAVSAISALACEIA